MQREMIERKCDVCGRRAQTEKCRIGDCTFLYWYKIEKCIPLGHEEPDICGPACLVKYAIRESGVGSHLTLIIDETIGEIQAAGTEGGAGDFPTYDPCEGLSRKAVEGEGGAS